MRAGIRFPGGAAALNGQLRQPRGRFQDRIERAVHGWPGPCLLSRPFHTVGTTAGGTTLTFQQEDDAKGSIFGADAAGVNRRREFSQHLRGKFPPNRIRDRFHGGSGLLPDLWRDQVWHAQTGKPARPQAGRRGEVPAAVAIHQNCGFDAGYPVANQPANPIQHLTHGTVGNQSYQYPTQRMAEHAFTTQFINLRTHCSFQSSSFTEEEPLPHRRKQRR